MPVNLRQQIRQRLDEQLRVDAGDIVFEAACGEEEMRRGGGLTAI